MRKNKAFDIVVIGAGMAGLSLAALLGRMGKCVAVVDRETPQHLATEAFDARTVALSAGSRAILAPLGLWPLLATQAQAITEIDVQQGFDAHVLNFTADDAQAEAFGWILPNTHVRRVLYEAAVKHGVEFFTPRFLRDCKSHSDHIDAILDDGNVLQAQLLCGVDGKNSRVRALCGIDSVNLDYGQTAWVGLVTHAQSHNGLALERFYAEGPFAMLPFTDDANGLHRSAVVWTRHHGKHKAMPLPAPDDLSAQLNAMLDARYGDTQAIGKWAAYPLGLTHAKSFVAERVVLVSDAAHAIHPIAGQGLNVGLRDVAKLVALLDGADDCGAPELLQEYDRTRRADAFAMIAATDLLNRLFGNNVPGVRALRSWGLGLVDRIPPLKRFFMRTAMGEN